MKYIINQLYKEENTKWHGVESIAQAHAAVLQL